MSPSKASDGTLKKVHKVIQDERQDLRSEDLKARAQALDRDDPRRMAYHGNGSDKMAWNLLGALPVAQIHLTPLEWTTSVSLHMGIRSSTERLYR